jgi:GNAT superfamily N-acetyltransferase
LSATVTLRHGTQADWPHVANSFIEQYKLAPHASGMSYAMLDKCIKALLRSSAWVLTVMAPTDGGDEILGWVLWQNKAVAWVNVKEMYRGHGFARVLLNAANCNGGDVHTPFVPNRTALALNFPMFCESKGFRIRHRPGLLLKEILGT